MPERPSDGSGDGVRKNTLEARLQDAAAEATSRLRRPRVRPMLEIFAKLFAVWTSAWSPSISLPLMWACLGRVDRHGS